MIEYSWSFRAFDCAPSESGLSDVVKKIHWSIEGSEPKPDSGNWSSSVIGVTVLDPIDDSNNFIPFDQITTGIAINWISGKINLTGENGVYENILGNIERQKTPTLVRKMIGVSGSTPI